MSVPPLTIQMFGQLSCLVHGLPLAPLRSRKGYWLLGLLALQDGREASRKWLVDQLWPDSDSLEGGRDSLRTSLRDLAAALQSEADRLTASRSAICLDVAEADVDVLAFDAAVQRGDWPDLEEAVRLYRGPLLDGCDESWVLVLRERRRQAYLQAVERLAMRSAAGGETQSAVSHLQLALAADPGRESAVQTLMRVRQQAEDYGGALEDYQALRRHLASGLNRTEPHPDTTRLYQHVRTQARRAARPAPDVPSAVPPSGTLHLPHPIAPIVGREQETRGIQASLLFDRLVTLTGMGGVGKTRLALHAATGVADQYPDGVYFVDFAPVADPRLVQHALASALGVREEPGRTLTESLDGHLRPKALLLVFDNCEHLLEACALLAAYLLANSRQLRILATSREPLGVIGETLHSVSPLSLPEDAQPASKAEDASSLSSRSEAVGLFVERAAAATAFSLSASNAPTVLEICRRLDGIPLALELAAARLSGLTLGELARRLDDRFRLLAGGNRSAPPRQQTLEATLDWSYDLLTHAERLLLGRLSVFCGGWTLAMAEAVCEGEGIKPEEVCDLLARLVEKSLVTLTRIDGPGRFMFLETVRQYAQGRLAPPEQNGRLYRRMAVYFIGHFGRSQVVRVSGPEQTQWLEAVESEHNNLRAAMDWSLGSEPELGLKIAVLMHGFWKTRGILAEGRERLLAFLSATGPVGARAPALNAAAGLSVDMGDFDDALRLAKESQGLAREAEDWPALTHSLALSGGALGRQGNYGQAEQLLEEAAGICERTGDRLRLMRVVQDLGLFKLHQGNYQSAQTHFAHSAQLSETLGDRNFLADVLTNQATAAFAQANLPVAQRLLERALAVYGECGGDGPGRMTALDLLGTLKVETCDYGAARALYEQVIAMSRKIGDKHRQAISTGNLGFACVRLGAYGASRDAFHESLILGHAMGDRHVTVCLLEGVYLLANAEQRYRNAARLQGAACALRQAFSLPRPSSGQPEHDQAVSEARSALGEEAYEDEWAVGQGMSLDAAVAYALKASAPPATIFLG